MMLLTSARETEKKNQFKFCSQLANNSMISHWFSRGESCGIFGFKGRYSGFISTQKLISQT